MILSGDHTMEKIGKTTTQINITWVNQSVTLFIKDKIKVTRLKLPQYIQSKLAAKTFLLLNKPDGARYDLIKGRYFQKGISQK